MSRIRRALQALTTPDATHATVVTSPRARGEVSPYRTVNRDRVMEATIAPPGARQTWQLHRVREESRDLQLRSPIWGGYVHFTRIQTLGYELSRLQFDRQTEEQAARLGEVNRHLRREWRRFQTIPGIGGAGQTVHQLAGQVLHHVDVDGDCFLTRRMRDSRTVWDLHPGDALAEHQNAQAIGGGEQILLGVVSDPYGRPVAFLFGEGGKPARLNWGFVSYASTVEVKRVQASRVLHIRDRSGESTAVRGWPRCTTVIEDIARLDEWYGALVRSAALRAAIGLALEQDALYGAPGDLSGRAPGDRVRSAGDSAFSTEDPGQFDGETVRPYQEFAAKAGSIMELDPGYKVSKIDTGSPTSQEAQAIGMLERRVCAALRTTPATLLGDYTSLSFSAGQLGHLQERQAIEDRQMILCGQFYGPVFRDFLMARWQRLMGEFSELMPDDLEALLYPTVRLRRYQILDKGRLVKPMLDAWERGLMTYPELRAELGFSGADADEVIEEWKENRKALGLPETPAESNGANMPGEDKSEDDKPKDDEDKDGDDGDD